MKRPCAFIIAVILLFQVTFSTRALCDDAFIKKVVITNLNGDVVVFFNLEGAFTGSIIRAIENGIPTTFTFLIELNAIKSMWFDSTKLDLTILRTIKYDRLKKQYIVTQSIGEAEETELKITSDFEEAKKAMEEFKNIFIIASDKLKKDQKYELGLKAKLEKVKLPFYLEYVLIFVSVWDFETDWYIEEFVY